MGDHVVGAMILAYAIIALFFLRFWRQTGDRLFAAFSAAFWLMTVGRIAVALNRASEDDTYYLYLFRLAAYLIILYAIIDKNRARRGRSPESAG
jgi:peptidoglycan/LPS O-acetylase OafA/YrhL